MMDTACNIGFGYHFVCQKRPEWGDWKPWSDCTKTCGGVGTRTRSRECTEDGVPSAFCPGDGDKTETEECHLGDCRKYSVIREAKTLFSHKS